MEGTISIPRLGHPLCCRMVAGTMLLSAAPTGWKVSGLPFKVPRKSQNLRSGYSLFFFFFFFAEADATGPWSPALGAQGPVLAVQHLLLQ